MNHTSKSRFNRSNDVSVHKVQPNPGSEELENGTSKEEAPKNGDQCEVEMEEVDAQYSCKNEKQENGTVDVLEAKQQQMFQFGKHSDRFKEDCPINL